MSWAWKNDDQEQPFMDLIRRTLLHSVGDQEYPYLRLKGVDSEQDFDLDDETMERFGWVMRFSSPIVYYAGRTVDSTYHWHFVGNAFSSELKEVFWSSGLENVFTAYWDSELVSNCLDHNGFVYPYNGPGVNIMQSKFTLDYVPRAENVDWDKFKQGIEEYSVLVNLRTDYED